MGGTSRTTLRDRRVRATSMSYQLAEGRHAYLVSSLGAVEVNGVRLAERDGVAIENERVLRVTAIDDAEIVLVDVT